MQKPLRWVERLENYNAALAQLQKAVELSGARPLSDLEKQGAVQAFEFTHELAWNLLKDYFEFQGTMSLTGSRDASREAFQRGLVSSGDVWMEMIKSRNLTSHTYNLKIADDIAKKALGEYFAAFVELSQRMKSLVPK